MALDATKWQVRTDKSIRYIGGVHGNAAANYVTVLELHRWLMDLADDASVLDHGTDDFMDITTVAPSNKSFDTIIYLTNGYTLDDAYTTPASEFIFGGSIIQGTAGVDQAIYDGVSVVSNRGVVVNVIQNNTVLANKFWNNTPSGESFAGLNPDPANGVAMRFMVKVKTADAFIDNGSLIFTTREEGKTYSEFRIPSTGRGVNVVPLTYTADTSGYSFSSANPVATRLKVWPSATVTNCQFRDLTVYDSTLDGNNLLRDCAVRNLLYVEGILFNCTLAGTIQIAGTTNTYLLDCKSGCVGLGDVDLPKIDLSAGEVHVVMRNWAGPVKFINGSHAASTLCVDIGSGGTVIIDATCTAGVIYVRGVGNIVDSLGNRYVNGTGKMEVRHEAHLDVWDIADEVLAQAQLTPIHSDTRKWAGQAVKGTGTETDQFRSTLVP